MYAPAQSRRWRLRQADHERLARAAALVFGAEANVLAVYLHGSAARGEAAADLDIAVLFSGPFDALRLQALAARLQAEGAPQGPEIDLRPLDGAPPRFQANVLRDARLLFERDRAARLEREACLLSRWADFRPTWERMRRLMLDRWARG